ncbi:DUF2336 domain-containing protein [Sphingobium aquiterrae]|uniref:DUF2336 domain-containing protein n=1 Tax=Sphingobium aquiterrae TaxID=2038656 RepID=UPI003019533E
MAELSFSNDAGIPDGLWSPVARPCGPVGAATRHMLDLARFFPVDGLHWSDMLVSETRRHLAGCTNAVETALVMDLDAAIAGALPGGGDRIAWSTLQTRPQVIGASLLSHMRLRAGVGLLMRGALEARGEAVAPAGEDSGWLIDDADAVVAQAAVALALAEGRWSVIGGEDMPMRPDLPAEYFAELVWMVAAVLGTALARAGVLDRERAMEAVDAAALRLLARHDEQAGALAHAVALARLLRDRPDHAEHLGRALAQGRILLFAALAADRARIRMEAVLDALIQQPLAVLAGLCHVLGGSSTDFRHLLLRLMPVRGLDDSALVIAGARFEALTADEAKAAIVPLRRPEALRGPLAMLGEDEER